MVGVVALFADADQRYVPLAPAPFALSEKVEPWQKLLAPLIMAAGNGLTVNTWLAEALQPLASVTLTVYVPPVVPVMVGVVAAFADQRYVPLAPAPLAVSENVEPWQKLLTPLMLGTGKGLTVNTWLAEALQPLASVTLTV